MSKKQVFKPSEAELEILQILWKHQPSTVREIHESKMVRSTKKEN